MDRGVPTTCIFYIYIYIYSDDVSLLLPLYTYTAAPTVIATAAFPADDALGRLDNDNDAFRTMMVYPLVLSPLSSHLTALIYALQFSDAIP